MGLAERLWQRFALLAASKPRQETSLPSDIFSKFRMSVFAPSEMSSQSLPKQW